LRGEHLPEEFNSLCVLPARTVNWLPPVKARAALCRCVQGSSAAQSLCIIRRASLAISGFAPL
jgi:hypothetical protein